MKNKWIILVGAGHLEVASGGAGLDLGTNEYTLELWYRLESVEATGRQQLLFLDYPHPTFGFGGYPIELYLEPTNTSVDDGITVCQVRASSGASGLQAWVPLDVAWHHLALVRFGFGEATRLLMFADGELIIEGPEMANNAFEFGVPASPVAVGALLADYIQDDDGNYVEDGYATPSAQLVGSVSNVRLIRGQPRYLFTPPEPPLAAISDSGLVSTPLLMLADGILNESSDLQRSITIVGGGVGISTTDVPS